MISIIPWIFRNPFLRKSFAVKYCGGLNTTSWSCGECRVFLWCFEWLAQNAWWLCQPIKENSWQKKLLVHPDLKTVPCTNSWIALLVNFVTVPWSKAVKIQNGQLRSWTLAHASIPVKPMISRGPAVCIPPFTLSRAFNDFNCSLFSGTRYQFAGLETL